MAAANRKLYWWSRLTFLLGAAVLVVGVLYSGPLPAARADSCGYVNVTGSSWASGQGVDSHSNYPYEGDGSNSCTGAFVTNLSATPPQYGWGWQCVELAQRMYNARSWYSGVFNNVNVAADIWTQAASDGFSTMQQGSITLSSIRPGDMLVTHESYAGHVMLVDYVSGNNIYTVDQNGADGGRTTVTFSNGSLSDSGFQFSGVVYSSKDTLGNGGGGGQPSTPFAVTRDTNDIDLAYNDNNNNVWYYHWNANTGWSHLNWSDNAAGQPCVVARDSTDLDFFYRSTTGKLMHRSWNQTSGVWTGPTAEVNSGVDGDPSCVARDSNDVQAFWLGNNGSEQSIGWNANNSWGPVQTLYNSGGTGDSYAVSRSSDSMEVFFGKNNGNLVHVYWSSENGWQTEDFSAGAGVTGKPSCIVRNSGNDMSCYYQENGNGKVAEEAWDHINGWGWQDWTASLAGGPSAITGVSNTIDDFYRETGGNIVDRYFSSCGWCTTNIVGSGSATGNPNAVGRGGYDIEVFYWDNTGLMDAHWDSTHQTWSTSQLN